MAQHCVVLVDGAHARFLSLGTSEADATEGGPNLVEVSDLINPEGAMSGGELWSENKTGRGTGGGGQAHGYDDHRENHEEEYRKRFAKEVARGAVDLIQKQKADHITVAAQSRMLATVKAELTSLLPGGVRLQEVAKDISKLSASQVHEYLSKENLIPARKAPVV